MSNGLSIAIILTISLIVAALYATLLDRLNGHYSPSWDWVPPAFLVLCIAATFATIIYSVEATSLSQAYIVLYLLLSIVTWFVPIYIWQIILVRERLNVFARKKGGEHHTTTPPTHEERAAGRGPINSTR